MISQTADDILRPINIKLHAPTRLSSCMRALALRDKMFFVAFARDLVLGYPALAYSLIIAYGVLVDLLLESC